MMAGYDQVIVAFGYRSSDEIDLANCGIENYTIGDARAARSAKMAIYEATKLALSI